MKQMVEVKEALSNYDGYTIQQLYINFDPDARIDCYRDYDESDIFVVYSREETDDEYSLRLLIENCQNNPNKVERYKEYLKLKKEFEV